MLAVVAALVGGLIAVYRTLGPQMGSNVQHFAAGVVFAAVAAELLPEVSHSSAHSSQAPAQASASSRL